jgi:hypothetical protein
MIGIKELPAAVMTKKLAFVDRFLVVFPVWFAVLVSVKLKNSHEWGNQRAD